jgi:hypothetical protein
VTVAYLSLSVSGDSEDLRIEHALEHSPRTLLRGQAGSGKTTLLQWIAVNASRSTFTGSLADWNGSIPFLVRLRSYPDGNLPQPQDLVASNASPIAGQTPEGWAHRQFTTGRALLLVDGVDELRAERRPRVRKWLSELLVAFPRIRVVVTSRPSAAEPAWLNGFRSLVLQPMTPADVTAFCRRWHEAIREVGAPAELDEYEIALARQLESRRHLRTLASSPLLCALLCALNLDRHKQLPPDRMKLYEASLELLLERRDAERDLPVVQDLQMATKSKLTILQHLAWWLTLNGRSEASRSEATTQVSLAITRMPDVSGDPTVVLNYLIERSGVIREPVTDRIDFIHRTFQEYLAGKQAAEEHFMDFLVRNAHLDQWRETVVMGAGHATIPLRTTLLNSLLDRASKETRHARRLKIVAASCLDTAHTMTPEVIERVEGALDQLIPPRRPNEARSLSLGGDRVLRRLPQTLDGLTSSQAAACVRTASFIGGQEALKLLTSYAASPDWSAQKEIARAWRYFPAERYAAEVLSDAPLVNGRILVERLEHIHFLQDLTRLTDTWINVLHDRDVDNLTFLANARHLSTLLVGCTPETCVDLRSLSEHSGLQFASIHTPGGHAVNLDALGSLTSLDYLGLPLPPGLSDVEFVRAIPSVRTLRLLEAAGLRDLSALAWLRNLQEFGAWGCPDLPQLPPTTTATRFCFGKIPLQTVIAAIEPLITQITSLHLDYCYGDLSLLMSPTLTSLELREYAMTDLSPLANLPSLRTLKYDGEVDVDLGPNVTVKRWR